MARAGRPKLRQNRSVARSGLGTITDNNRTGGTRKIREFAELFHPAGADRWGGRLNIQYPVHENKKEPVLQLWQ
jgi:hypothetical protein